MKKIARLALFSFATLGVACASESPNPTEEVGAVEDRLILGSSLQTCTTSNDCEDAWAGYGGEEPTPFSDHACLKNDNRWGWSIGALDPGVHVFEIHAGGGGPLWTRNNPTLVGTLLVSYDGSTAVVRYSIWPGHELDATHLYVGNQPLEGYSNHCTVAPEQFPYVDETYGLTTKTYTVNGLSGRIYLTAHAVVRSTAH